MSRRRIFWISGWSIPAAWLAEAAAAAIPGTEHSATDPGPDALDRALASGCDILAGFSLGAHLLLAANGVRPRLLLAPFVDLKREAGLGGAVATTQVRQLQRMLRREPTAAVADFHRRIGFASGGAPDLTGLAWGLERMLLAGVRPLPLGPQDVAIAGDSDPLLDIAALRTSLPALRVVAGAGHDPAALLAAAAKIFPVPER